MYMYAIGWRNEKHMYATRRVSGVNFLQETAFKLTTFAVRIMPPLDSCDFDLLIAEEAKFFFGFCFSQREHNSWTRIILATCSPNHQYSMNVAKSLYRSARSSCGCQQHSVMFTYQVRFWIVLSGNCIFTISIYEKWFFFSLFLIFSATGEI